ncbi:glutathione S-transferase family protein [Vulcanococcus sp.]|uniref:glutathione S-transferase family protein n=1 Tax=Vulcanococcus sp. TaxID=2856995 RepID=UPI003C0DFD3D
MTASLLELFHAAPSYYSMVARLALAEAGVSVVSRLLDIHLAKQQLSPSYRRLNPHMTVPTLRGPGLLLCDSSEILRFAAQQAGADWADQNPASQGPIATAVDGHYRLSIEALTFSKLLSRRPWMQPLVIKVLGGVIASLEEEASRCPDNAEVLLAKAQQNRERRALFADQAADAVLAIQREQVAGYLASLPAVQADRWLFAEQISSADVVLAVLFARLEMSGEHGLITRSDLQQWWNRYQRREAFTAADVWTRFKRRAFLAAVLQARQTVITA